MTKDRFGSLLRKYRDESHLILEGLMKELEAVGCNRYSKGTISKWENGKHLPDKDTVEQLEKILEIPNRRLLKAAGYLLNDEPQNESVTPVQRTRPTANWEGHFRDLAKIAKSLLAGGLDKITPDYEIFNEGYKSEELTFDKVVRRLNGNIDVVLQKKGGKRLFDRFQAHLHEENRELIPLKGDLRDAANNNPMELIDLLSLLEERKVFKGKCPVCEGWQ